MNELIGTTIGGYTITALLGKGGMGLVYRARQESIGRDVALKILREGFESSSGDVEERFYREVQIIASTQHPNILPVHDYGAYEGKPYIVMSLIEGGTLRDRIKAAPNGMSLPEIVSMVRQIANALDAAHQYGVIHRDMKPDNVLLDKAGNAYIADFGLATSSDSKRLTGSGGVLGTPHYMAPEWAEADEITHSVDVYALGVMVYEMLTGVVPFDGHNAMAVLMGHVSQSVPDVMDKRPDLPYGMRDVVYYSLAKSPEERFASAGDVATAFETALLETGHPSRTIMPKPQKQEDYYLNVWALGVFIAAHKTLGREAFEAVLVQAGLPEYIGSYPDNNMRKEFPFSKLQTLWCALSDIYGDRGLQSLGRRAGYEAFFFGLKNFGAMGKAARAMINTAGQRKRYFIGLRYLSNMFNSLSDQKTTVEDADGEIIWRVTRCPFCGLCEREKPQGHYYMGNFHGLFNWIDNNQAEIKVKETSCMAMGDAEGVFVITKPEA